MYVYIYTSLNSNKEKLSVRYINYWIWCLMEWIEKTTFSQSTNFYSVKKNF